MRLGQTLTHEAAGHVVDALAVARDDHVASDRALGRYHALLPLAVPLAHVVGRALCHLVTARARVRARVRVGVGVRVRARVRARARARLRARVRVRVRAKGEGQG